MSSAMSAYVWTSAQGGFWRVWQDGNGDGPQAPMSGTLHGQSWANVLGLGWLLPAEQARGYRMRDLCGSHAALCSLFARAHT